MPDKSAMQMVVALTWDRLTLRCSRHAAPGCGAETELRRRRTRLNFGVRRSRFWRPQPQLRT
jgi:hypothetical protein